MGTIIALDDDCTPAPYCRTCGKDAESHGETCYPPLPVWFGDGVRSAMLRGDVTRHHNGTGF